MSWEMLIIMDFKGRVGCDFFNAGQKLSAMHPALAVPSALAIPHLSTELPAALGTAQSRQINPGAPPHALTRLLASGHDLTVTSVGIKLDHSTLQEGLLQAC